MGQGSPEHVRHPLLPATEPGQNTVNYGRLCGKLRSERVQRLALTLIARVEVQLLPGREVVRHVGHEVAHTRLKRLRLKLSDQIPDAAGNVGIDLLGIELQEVSETLKRLKPSTERVAHLPNDRVHDIDEAPCEQSSQVLGKPGSGRPCPGRRRASRRLRVA